MKIEPKKPVTRKLHGIVWTFLVVITLCSQHDVIAQTQLAVVQPNNSVDAYIAKNQNSALVKLYQFNSKDPAVLIALRYAAVLESPMKSKFSAADVARMQAEVEKASGLALKIEELAKQNGSYERAAIVYQNQNRSTQQTKGATNAPRQVDGPPVFTLPAQK